MRRGLMARLQVGDRAPNFSALIQDGSTVSLEQILETAESGLLLYFYPKDSTPGCTTQAGDFRDHWQDLQQNGWKVIGVSRDGEESHRQFIEANALPFDLIVDADAELMEAFRAWGEKTNYGRKYMGVIRSTFAIDSSGTIVWAGYGVRAKGHVERVLRDLGIG